jgi:hypothetical protein
MNRYLLALAAAVLFAAPAAAMEADDVVRLTKANVGDEVIVAQMRAAKARFVLSADEIVRLKKDGVSDAVLKAMIESAKAQPAKEPPADARAGEENQPPAAEPKATDVGLLILENLDSRDYSVQVDARNRNVFYWKASGAEGREPMPARSSQVYRLAPGNYRLTWVSGADNHLIKVLPGKESRATLTRTSAEGTEVVYLSLFEDGDRRGGGRLATLADRSPAERPVVAPVQAPRVVERQYYSVPAQPAGYVAGGVYDSPHYYDYGRHYGWLMPGLSAGWGHGSNRFSLGLTPYGDLGFSWSHRLGRHSGFSLGWGW